MFNKFKVIKYVVFGLTAFTATTQASRYVGVSLNPSVELASRVVPPVQEGIVYGGNYLWNKEVEYENKDFRDVKFEEKDDFEEIGYITKSQELAELEEKLAKDRAEWELEEN